MQIILIGLFAIALLMGALSTLLNKPSGKESWLGGMIRSVSLTSKQQANKVEFEEMTHRFQEQRESFNQHIQDQRQYLKDVQDQMNSLSEIISQMPDQDNEVSLLPLKDLVKKIQSQNKIITDQAQELEDFNEKQKNIDSHGKSMEDLKKIMDSQEKFLGRQGGQYQELKNRLDQLQSKIQKISKDVTFQRIPQLTDKVRFLSLETSYYLEILKGREAEIERANQDKSIVLNLEKAKREELKKRNEDYIFDNHNKIEDQTREINDRIRDQIERARDRSRR